jgi:hypothetical protein
MEDARETKRIDQVVPGDVDLAPRKYGSPEVEFRLWHLGGAVES